MTVYGKAPTILRSEDGRLTVHGGGQTFVCDREVLVDLVAEVNRLTTLAAERPLPTDDNVLYPSPLPIREYVVQKVGAADLEELFAQFKLLRFAALHGILLDMGTLVVTEVDDVPTGTRQWVATARGVQLQAPDLSTPAPYYRGVF